MKRFISVLLSAVMAFSLCVTAFADDSNNRGIETYYIPELGMSIDLPNSYYAATRQVSKSDPYILKFESTTYEDFISFLYKYDVYLMARDIKINRSIMLSAYYTDQYENLNNESDALKDDLVSWQASIHDADRVVVAKWFCVNGITFIETKLSMSDGSHMTFFYTIVDNMQISISFTGEKTPYDAEVIKSIVESIKFDSIESKQQKTDSRKNNVSQGENIYCRMCGESIPSDSNFCPKCGTKVVK